MATKTVFKGPPSDAIHSSAAMLQKVGAMDATTMRDFDARHLIAPRRVEPAPIERLHEAEVGARNVDRGRENSPR